MLNGHSGQSRHTVLDAKLSEQLFQVGFVDEHFTGLVAIRWRLDGAFIERLKQPHLGDRVFLAARKRASVLLGPGLQRGLPDKDFEGKSETTVGGDYVSKFASGTTAPSRAIALEEVVLIDVAVSGGVALDAAHGIGARHGRIIGGAAGEVNEGNWTCGWFQSETASLPSSSKSERSGIKVLLFEWFFIEQ